MLNYNCLVRPGDYEVTPDGAQYWFDCPQNDGIPAQQGWLGYIEYTGDLFVYHTDSFDDFSDGCFNVLYGPPQYECFTQAWADARDYF